MCMFVCVRQLTSVGCYGVCVYQVVHLFVCVWVVFLFVFCLWVSWYLCGSYCVCRCVESVVVGLLSCWYVFDKVCVTAVVVCVFACFVPVFVGVVSVFL